MSPSDSRNRILEMVTSGNSARSSASTSPIDRCARAGRLAALTQPPRYARRPRERALLCSLVADPAAHGAHLRGNAAVPVVFFNHSGTTQIYTLSLHDALPI